MAKTKSQKPLAEAPPEPDSSEAEPSSSTEAEDEPTNQTNEEEEEEEEGDQEASSSTAASSDDEPPLKKPTQPKQQPSSDSSSEEEEEEEEDVKVSPVKSQPKPIMTPPKPSTATKPRSTPKPTVTALTAEKRGLESDDVKGMTSSKRARKGEMGGEEGLKKQASVPFQRLFSEDDEIAMLKGMIEYRAKKGADPMIEVDDFYGFLKDSLDAEVSRGQFVDKIRRLKKRFSNAAQKKKKLTNPREVLAFELSKKIWEFGGDGVTVAAGAGGEEKGGSNGVVVESNVGVKSSSKGRVIKSKSPGGVVPVIAEEKKAKGDDRIGEAEEGVEVGEAAANENVRRKGLRLMGAKARAELSEMWEKVVVAQREVDSMRLDVQKEENRRILEAVKLARQGK